ncbi:hypothetical protein B0G57_105245 [Trinickia symbiotica]|nr:hypothetical protein B0G57_105245 [Trinickia symbiotica]
MKTTVEKLDTRIDVENVPTELSALTQSLNAMLDRLHRGFERISQYTADLAHDMRTPLGNLRGSAEVALARTYGRGISGGARLEPRGV